MPSQNSAEQEACRADPGPVEISIDRSQKGGAEFSRCEISSRILKARPENPGADPNRKNAITIHERRGVVCVHGVWQLRRAPTAPCTGSRAFSSALGTRTQHVAYRPLVTPFGSHPHTKTPKFVVGTAEGPIASELDSSALTNSMLPRGLRHHYRSGWEDALTPRLHW